MEPNLTAKIEALLFIHGESMSIQKIASALSVDEGTAEQAIIEIQQELNQDKHGVFLVINQDDVQLVSKPEYREIVKDMIKDEMQENLTPATLETLSIISYAGPISKSELEYIRGVNSNFTLRTLLLRGLIERQPDSKRKNSFLYQPSLEFLKHIGANQIQNLPEYSRFRELLKTIRTTPETPPTQP